MTIKTKSFEEFFYIKTDNICDIEIVSDYVDKHDGDYSPYKGFMLCPECQKAELNFVHKSSFRRAHLKKIPSANHLEDCSYNFEYASKKLVKEYVEILSYNQVQDKLNAMMNMLCNNAPKDGVKGRIGTTGREAKDNPILIPDSKEAGKFKAIRRKKLAGWIDKSDGTDLHIFYGTVKLSVKEKNGKNSDGKEYLYYLLTLKTQNKDGEWKFRASIYRGGKKDIMDESRVYQIAMIGNLNFEGKWLRIDLINKNAIQFR
ncbi:hypothetical protein [Acetobacterium malicum]|uniref:hypothetical protein n=1 Tax=Acetobacterium malicum TaxID=52692 RepID=UPI0003FC3CDB|nr:hypothetical protein [Acetobacterium dehalogenans]